MYLDSGFKGTVKNGCCTFVGYFVTFLPDYTVLQYIEIIMVFSMIPVSDLIYLWFVFK